MSETVKRIRFRRIDLENINDSLERYIKSLSKELAEHEEDEGRFNHPDEWLQKREKLNLHLTNSKHIQNKVTVNLKGLRGRTPEPLKYLLNVTAEDKLGEYIRVLQASWLLPFVDLWSAINILFNAAEQGTINSYRDNDDDGLLKVRKLDVLRLAVYLEAHR